MEINVLFYGSQNTAKMLAKAEMALEQKLDEIENINQVTICLMADLLVKWI